MKLTRVAGAALLAVFLPSGAVAAQAPEAVQRLVGEALETNHLLAAESYEERAARAEARAAAGRMLPTIDLESRVSEQQGGLNLGDFVNPAYSALNQLSGGTRFPTDLDLTLPQRHDSHVRITQPLFAPGLWAGREASAREADAAGLGRRAAARQLAADVQAAYYRAASAARAVEIRRSAVELTLEAERVAERLVDAGGGTPDVVLRARAERSEAEQGLLEAGNDAAAALRALNQLVGRPLETPLDPITENDLLVPIPVTREEAIASATARREEVAALGAAVEAADAGVRAASSSFLPSVAVALDYGAQGNEIAFDGASDYVIGSLVFSWNLFSGGSDAARRQLAAARRSELRARQADASEKVLLDVHRAYDAAVAAEAAIAVARDREAAAVRAHQLVQRRFEEGLAANVELIDARRSRTAAELNLSLTLYGYAARLADLERAAALRPID